MVWLPRPVYETFPFATLVVGGICVIAASNLLMVISGALLVLTSTVILKMRRSYRSEADRRSAY